MKDNNLDKIIKDTYIEFNDQMDVHSSIDIPQFNSVMKKFNSNVKKNRNNSSVSRRLALVAAFTIVILITTFVSSIPKVIAFKFNVIKTFEELRGDTKDIKFSTKDNLNNNINDKLSKSNSNVDQIEKIVSLDEARKEISFKLLVPEYLPSEYKLSSVKLVKAMGDYCSINLSYINTRREIIQIYQSTISELQEETISISSQLKVENIIINNIKIKLTTDNKNFKNMVWINNNIKFEMLVPNNITDTEIKRIIESLK